MHHLRPAQTVSYTLFQRSSADPLGIPGNVRGKYLGCEPNCRKAKIPRTRWTEFRPIEAWWSRRQTKLVRLAPLQPCHEVSPGINTLQAPVNRVRVRDINMLRYFGQITTTNYNTFKCQSYATPITILGVVTITYHVLARLYRVSRAQGVFQEKYVATSFRLILM